MAESATKKLSLQSSLAAQRDAALEGARSRLLWQERLTSLWTPVLLFLFAFAPYIALVQFRPEAAAWARPALKAFGALMIVAFVALLLTRLASKRLAHLRRARIEARELLLQLDRELARTGQDPNAGPWPKLIQQAAAVDAGLAQSAPDALTASIKRLSELADQKLPGWRKRATYAGARGLVLTLLAVLLLRTLFVEPFKIPSGSMLPTLQIGDHVVVNRFLYGVRIPFMNVVPFVIVRPPARGDIIVFENPLDSSKDFIKRVIGVPGDRVEIVDEVIHINGVPQERQLVHAGEIVFDEENGRWTEERRDLYEENLSGVSHAVLESPYHPRGHITEGTYVVPDGAVFVMGDNRDNSADGRYGFGVTNQPAFVPYGNIKGKAMVVWLNLGHAGVLSGLFGGTGLRTDRLFTPLR